MYKKNIRLLTIFNFLTGFSLFAPLAIVYFSQVSGSYTLGASIFGIAMLSSAIFEIPTGIWSDKVGRKQTIILGSWARILSFVFYAIGLSYWWLVAGAILKGVSSSLYSGNNDAFLRDTLADDNLVDQYDEYLGKTKSSMQFAMGLSALIGGFIANFSFTYLMWFSVISQVAMLYISYLFIDPKSRIPKNTNIYAHTKEAIKLFIHNKKLRLLSLTSMFNFSIGEVKWEFTSAFVATVWPVWAIGISRMLPSFGASLSYFYSGKIIRKYTEVKILLLNSFIGKIISFVAYGFPTILSPIFLAIPSLLYGVGSVAENTLMQREFTDHQRATMSSLNSLGGSIGFAIMSVVLGGLADFMGPARALIILTIISLPTIYLRWILFQGNHNTAV